MHSNFVGVLLFSKFDMYHWFQNFSKIGLIVLITDFMLDFSDLGLLWSWIHFNISKPKRAFHIVHMDFSLNDEWTEHKTFFSNCFKYCIHLILRAKHLPQVSHCKFYFTMTFGFDSSLKFRRNVKFMVFHQCELLHVSSIHLIVENAFPQELHSSRIVSRGR